ncbi:unnamed protein product [Arabidopsis halleri]
MVRPIVATSSVNPNPTVEESFVMMEPSEHYVNSVRQIHDQSRLVCRTDQERHLLNQDLVKFWAHHNSIGLHEKLDLPLARIKKVMKSDPQVKMVSSDSHVLLAKACDIFIEEVTLRAWRHTQSCSRNTIQSCDIYKALKESVVYDELTDLVSFGQHSVTHQGVPQDVVQQQLFPSANMNVPEMKDPIDIDKIQQQCLYYQITEHFIDIGEFELDPKYQQNLALKPSGFDELKPSTGPNSGYAEIIPQTGMNPGPDSYGYDDVKSPTGRNPSANSDPPLY